MKEKSCSGCRYEKIYWHHRDMDFVSPCLYCERSHTDKYQPMQTNEEQIIDRLAEYENTGLEPKEVQLIANVLREVGETYNCHFNFVVKALKEYANANEKGKRKAKEWERMVDAHGTLEGWLCPCGFSSGGAWSYCSGCGSEMYGGGKHED